ncbi:hypothetical protein [Streptomyces sp. SAJ15]|uniref:hypothetical protein n=1 Tax=Streptomyces sp. SAJ15 TaxID=2011095 RepID=UPI001184D786|nr:hypothetical protein [Streptomyces sp. SAJ15]TVL90977.1 hypothetical protein CD790_19255 [Streptomyces sp. SAJ15]
MVADRLARTVREQLGIGRLLPLGGPADGAWLTERAADGVLRAAARAVPGVRLDRLRIGLADPARTEPPALPPPPSALPPGPLRVEATLATVMDRPIPEAAEALRTALHTASTRRLGLRVERVDLRVTGLVDEPPAGPAVEAPGGRDTGGPATPGRPADLSAADLPPAAAAVAAATAGVPGVTGLAAALGGSGRAVTIEERADGTLAVLVQLAVAADHRALDVALAVRAAVAEAAATPTVSVLVTAVDA